jgi:uncharacterized protein (AIM24 family)
METSVSAAKQWLYSVDTYLRKNSEKGTPGTGFDQESERVLRIDVNGGVWIQPGAAIAYRGDIKFERLATLKGEGLKEMAMREASPLARASGKGRLYCAHKGWHLRVLELTGGSICVISESLLAFEETLQFDMFLVGHGVGVAASGLFAVKLSGSGRLAFAIHGDPLTMKVTPESPVFTDPHATLAWSGELEPELKTDLQWKALFEHGGGEPFQMVFKGDGYVTVQPTEEPGKFKWKPGSKLKSLIGL